MPDLRDLGFIRQETRDDARPHLEHAIIANTPADFNDPVFVIIPEFANDQTWGPYRWQHNADDMPAEGDECLIAFSNRREGWVVAYWSGVYTPPAGGGGGGGVTSFNTRTGAVVPASGDYTVAQVTGAAPLASPAFTGTPTAPTPATGDNSTTVATTAFVKNQGYLTSAPVTSVFTRTGAIVATTGDYTVAQVTGAAPLASPPLTGTPTAPTAAVDTNTTQLATTAFVLAQAASVAPLMDGTAAVGTSTRFARQDHVHPTDSTRAPLASPALTGVPTAPTAAPGTNTTQLATTAFVTTAVGGGGAVTSVFTRTGAVVAVSGDYTVAQVTGAAPLASPALTGTPTAPTAATADNSTTIATTAFVKAQGYIAKAIISAGSILTGTTSYTAPAGTHALEIEGWGGGGAGGSCAASGATTNLAMGQPGGAGSYAQKFLLVNIGTHVVAVGAGGTPGAAGANPGGPGGATTFKDTAATVVLSTLAGTGGNPSSTFIPGGTAITMQQGVGTSAGTQTGDVTVSPGRGAAGFRLSGSVGGQTAGSGSPRGGGNADSVIAAASSGTSGLAGTAPGGPGGGAIDTANTARAGSAGAAGLIAVRAYA
jgi:hypothetical protein